MNGSSQVEIRRASVADVSMIAQWRREAADWLASIGSDQWSEKGLSAERFVARVTSSVHAGETWVAEVDGRPAATLAVDEHTDPGLWTPAEQAESVIVHRMITDRNRQHRGLGALLLDHAETIARQRGKTYVRLDAWTSNGRLHDYYRAVGFRFVRIADPQRPSAALFERPVSNSGVDQQAV
ncbi:GNAT family N-acetyltransferase [Amycolatopsis sp. NPDC004378]